MTEDQLTYRRAANAALAGLGVQLLLTVVVGVLTIWSQSAAYTAATWHLLGGAIIWVALWLIFNQHRLERTEALEAEQLAAGAGQTGVDTSMFDEHGHELALSRKRLEGFYRWGLNVVSVTVAVYLLAAGGLLLYGYASEITTRPDERADFTQLFEIALANPAVGALALMLITAALALVGFLTARYVAGMTSEKQWSLLRGGSAYLMGNVVVLAAVVLACVFEMADNTVVFATLTLAIPALMIVLGLEVTLSFVFGAYRPRLPGEAVRPAFDSRLLGWLTRPDSFGKVVAETLNYQFGFEISRSWFYRLLGKAIVPLILLGVAVLIAMSCVVIVPPQRQALVTTFGRVDPETAVRDPGISFKAPWPFASARKYETSRVRSLRVGSLNDLLRTGAAMLWTNQHTEGQENFLLTAPPLGADAAEAQQAGAVSAGLIGGELVLQWRITDLLAYTSPDAAARPADYLDAVAESAFASYLTTKDIDTLLTSDRLDAAEELRQEIQQRVAGMGIEVVYAGLYGLHPPQDAEVATSFLQVVNALLTQRTTVAEARRDRVATLSEVAGSVDQAVAIDDAIRQLESLPQGSDRRAGLEAAVQELIDNAGGEAARVIAEARADRWRLALDEQARARSFAFEVDAFRRAPDYFKARTYFNTLAETLPQKRKIVTNTDTGNELPLIRLNLEDETSGLDAFLGDAQ